MKWIVWLIVVILVLLVVSCDLFTETGEPSPTPLTPSPTPTIDPDIEYILHVGTNTSAVDTRISWSGDYSGSEIIPFDIGPMTEPFTIRLNVEDRGQQPDPDMRLQYSHFSWKLDGEVIDTRDEPITVTVGGSNPDRTLEPMLRWNVLHPVILPELTVHFIDVGQGESILCDLGKTEVLIDGGKPPEAPIEYLKDFVDGALEVVVATNPNADHIGGLEQVLEAEEVLEIWHNGDTSDSWAYDKFMDSVRAEDARVHIAQLHDQIMVGDMSFYVMNPTILTDDKDNNSIVLHMQYGDVDFLFMSDAEQETEGEMLVRSSIAVPRVEILKVGQHGSKKATSTDFVYATKPEVAIYSCQTGNWYGYPHQEVISSLEDIGADIYGTDDRGTIVVTTNGISYTIECELTP